MMQRAATWGDVINYRSGACFVGRRSETEAFRLNCLYDVPQSLLFVIQGASGMGKSALLAQYRAIAHEHGVVTAGVSQWDVRLTAEFAAVQAMSVLAQQLTKAGMPLTSFGEVLREYEQSLRTAAADESAPGQVWDLLGGVFDDDTWVSGAWDEYLTHKVPSRRAELIKNPIDTLTARFVQDLNAWATVRKIVLCFDDWHRYPSHVSRWLLGMLSTGNLATGIWLVLATDGALGTDWQTLAPISTVSELQPLSEIESRAFLLDHGVMEEKTREQRSILGQGHPMALELLAETAGSIAAVSSTPLVDNYLAGLQPDLRATVLKCAAARRIDDGVLAALFSATSGGEPDREEGGGAPRDGSRLDHISKWLAESPLLIQPATGWRFRPAIHEDLIRWARAHEPATWQAAHRTLHAYYRQQLELRGADPDYLNPIWQGDQIEALYHGIAADEGTSALNAAFFSFAMGIRQFYPWAGSVVRALQSAIKVVSPEYEVARWVGIAESMLDALSARDWEPVLPMVDEILAAPIWGPEVKQAFRGIRQLVAARLSLAPEPEMQVELVPADDVAPGGAVSDAGPGPVETPDSRDAATSGTGVASASEVAAALVSSTTDVSPGTDEIPAAGTMPSHEVSAECSWSAESSLAAESESPAVDEDVAPAEVPAIEHCSYANMQLAAGDYEAAIQAYDQALALSPDYVAALYNRGLAYARLGALSSAIADFTRVVELDAGQPQAYHQRGLVYARKGDYERAVADYDVALSLRPDLASFIYDRANAFFRLNAYERAIQDYTRVLDCEPGRIEAYLNRGLALAAIKDYPEALRNYNEAIALDPGRAVSYSHRGQTYARLERYAEALADYEHALEINPRDAVVHNNRGLLYVRVEAYAEAIESYRQAMALHPDWATPYYNAACAAALSADAEQACVWLSRAVGLRERYRPMALRDTDFAAIRDHPGFQSIVQGTPTDA